MTIERAIKTLGLNIRRSSRRGRPKKFTLSHIIAYFVYKVKNKINSFRELECKINEDGKFKRVIGIGKSTDHSYFSKWEKVIEDRYIERNSKNFSERDRFSDKSLCCRFYETCQKFCVSISW